MKTKTRLQLTPIKILAILIFCCMAFFSIYFKLGVLEVLPFFISIVVLFLQTRVSRYAFLVGALNSVLYAAVFWHMTLYSQAVYSFLVSFPFQIATFLNWQKHTEKGVTEVRSFSARGRVLLFAGMIALWTVLYVIFSAFGSQYLIWDNTISVLGIVGTILGTLRYSEMALLGIPGRICEVWQYSAMVQNDISRLPFLIYAIYCLICVIVTFIKMNAGKNKKSPS